MQFSEDDLKNQLQRKDPGAAFSQRVMARINQQRQAPETTQVGSRGASTRWFDWLRLRPAWVAAVAAVVMAVAGLGGYRAYQEHQAERAKEEVAAQQAELAVRIATAKLSHVFKKVQANSHEPAN
jgi:type VI protein secretion system component VasF